MRKGKHGEVATCPCHVCNAASIRAPVVSPGCFPLQPQHSQTNEDGYLQRPHAQKAQWCSAQTVQLDRPDPCPSSATHQCGLRQMTWPPRVAVSPAENEVIVHTSQGCRVDSMG